VLKCIENIFYLLFSVEFDQKLRVHFFVRVSLKSERHVVQARTQKGRGNYNFTCAAAQTNSTAVLHAHQTDIMISLASCS